MIAALFVLDAGSKLHGCIMHYPAMWGMSLASRLSTRAIGIDVCTVLLTLAEVYLVMPYMIPSSLLHSLTCMQWASVSCESSVHVGGRRYVLTLLVSYMYF